MINKTYNAAVFVIPNGAIYCHEFAINSQVERYIRYCTDLCEQKGIKFDPDNDPIVQVWFTSSYNEDLCNDYLKDDNLKSDNLEAHGFWTDGAYYSFRYGYLPLPLIKDIKEGDNMDLEFEVEKEIVIKDGKRKYLEYGYGEKNRINLHITFDQRSYRYRNFGNFEDVVRKVVSHCVLPE